MTRIAILVVALAAVTLISPTVLGDEPAPRARVALLSSSSGATRVSPTVTRFFQELARLGYVDGVNLTIEYREAGDQPARLPDMARELVRLKPDVIFTVGTVESTVAAMQATSTIPIVFIHAVDPVRAGLVASLARPGGNVTGVTSLNADLGAKRLELSTRRSYLAFVASGSSSIPLIQRRRRCSRRLRPPLPLGTSNSISWRCPR